MFSFFRQKKWPSLDLAEVKKRARLLVIDDNEFSYASLFERDGYTMEKWDLIKDLSKLETGYYDIILLDIHGVGREISTEQGLGVLKHIRMINPAQIVIAYSNADWSLKYQDFFDLADAKLEKGRDYVEFKRLVDELLERRFSLEFYIDKICKTAGNQYLDDPKLRKLAGAAILRGNTKKLEEYVNMLNTKADALSLIIKIAKVAITIAAASL